MNKQSRAAVRPKSTHRKQRTAAPVRAQLAPVQDRSKQRHEVILKAVERLLERVNIEDLSHQDIATEAGISKPSVHYHFPTVAAIQRELGRRYDYELYLILVKYAETVPQKNTRFWEDCLRRASLIARDYFNSHRPACEALYGPMLHRENRLAGVGYNAQVGRASLNMISTYFDLPQNAKLEAAFTANSEIMDLFWSISYLRNGYIDDNAFEESMRACIGYLRNFIPEDLPARRRK